MLYDDDVCEQQQAASSVKDVMVCVNVVCVINNIRVLKNNTQSNHFL
jgi:hypothetical protein